ncbi:uncharacterized protein LOC124299187 [Neodiprion virginianus]|uniref:uncharacterized protein LOC124299187 n=1 Tax=Neodiprion virginianus TaxID=2961670 RepID=UPI001EE6F88D|nr:uncharacterized protein LOC124299187 [Neodiprion virginianus]
MISGFETITDSINAKNRASRSTGGSDTLVTGCLPGNRKRPEETRETSISERRYFVCNTEVRTRYSGKVFNQRSFSGSSTIEAIVRRRSPRVRGSSPVITEVPTRVFLTLRRRRGQGAERRGEVMNSTLDINVMTTSGPRRGRWPAVMPIRALRRCPTR